MFTTTVVARISLPFQDWLQAFVYPDKRPGTVEPGPQASDPQDVSLRIHPGGKNQKEIRFGGGRINFGDYGPMRMGFSDKWVGNP